jgi:hypothetical protein
MEPMIGFRQPLSETCNGTLTDAVFTLNKHGNRFPGGNLTYASGHNPLNLSGSSGKEFDGDGLPRVERALAFCSLYHGCLLGLFNLIGRFLRSPQGLAFQFPRHR